MLFSWVYFLIAFHEVKATTEQPLHQSLNYPSSQPTEDYSLINKDSVYQQGLQGQFLQFLRKLQYDRGQHPENENGDPVLIDVSLLVSNIRSISEINMEYSLEVFYRETWVDPRLQFRKGDFSKGFARKKNGTSQTTISLHESYADFLWRPDTFVPNAINSKTPSHESFTHRALYRLQEDGTVITSRRISLVVECSLDLTRYPFDKQLCKLGLESYGYTADQITYNWATKNGKTPLEMYSVRLPDFEITKSYATKRVVHYATGSYTRLYVCFEFSRSAGYCYLQLIIPSIAIVITAWLSLWRESDSAFQDMITILMSIIFLLYSYNSVMPRVSYIKAMDVYLGVCFGIAFISLIKLSIMTFLKLKIDKNGDPNNEYVQIQKTSDETMELPLKKRRTILNHQVLYACHFCSQILLAVGFVTFCIFYFFIFPQMDYTLIDPDCDPKIAVAEAVRIQ